MCGIVMEKLILNLFIYELWILKLTSESGPLSFDSHSHCISFLQEEQDIKALQIKNRKLGDSLDQRQVDTDLFIFMYSVTKYFCFK